MKFKELLQCLGRSLSEGDDRPLSSDEADRIRKEIKANIEGNFDVRINELSLFDELDVDGSIYLSVSAELTGRVGADFAPSLFGKEVKARFGSVVDFDVETTIVDQYDDQDDVHGTVLSPHRTSNYVTMTLSMSTHIPRDGVAKFIADLR